MKLRRLLFLLVLLAALTGALYLARKPILAYAANRLILEDPLEKSDALLVLSGDAPRRMIEAADLYKEGYAPLVLFHFEEPEPGFSELRKRKVGPAVAPTRNELNVAVGRALGIPRDKLLLSPYLVTRTYIEARDTLKWVKEIGGIRKLTVITSKTHTRRAGRIFREVFAGSGIEIRMRGDRFFPIEPGNWWRVNYQRRAVTYEWMATLAAPVLGRRE